MNPSIRYPISRLFFNSRISPRPTCWGLRYTSTASETTTSTKQISRLHKVNNKLPRFLQTYTTPLLSAPISHITSFLLLHELTAILPLVGLATLFHYTNWLPDRLVQGEWVRAGVEKWGRYFVRKGWVEAERSEDNSDGYKSGTGPGQEVDMKDVATRGEGWKVVLEVATAWAVVKAILPVRIVGCVWATPWFARVAVLPVMRVFGRRAK